MPSPSHMILATAARAPAVAPQLLALGSLSTANYYGTLAAGGEAGVSTGFGSVVLYVPTRLPSAYRGLAGKSNGSSEGWFNQLNAAALSGFSARGTSAWSEPLVRTLNSYDVGRIHCKIGWHTGSAVKVALDTLQQVTSLAVTGYTPSSIAHTLGKFGGGNGADDCLILGHLTFRGTPTDAQLQALLDLVRTKGDVPTAAEWVHGITHRWSLKETLAGQTVVDGQAAPATLADTITAATADVMTRVGSPVVRTIDPSIDGRKSYGVMGFSASSRLQTSAAVLNTATLSVELVVIFTSALASSMHILSNADGSSGVGGFSLYQSGNTLLLYSYGAGAGVGSATIPVSGTGYPRKVRFDFNGTVWRLFVDDVQQGSDTAAAHTPSSRALYLGSFGDGTQPSDNIVARSLRTGTFASPGQHYYDFTQDIAPAPDAGVPATIADRAGSVSMTRVGTGLLVSRRTERLYGYEALPIIRGARNWSVSNYLSVTTALLSTTSAYWLWIALVVHARTGGSFQAIMAKARADGQLGSNLYAQSTLGSIGFTHGNGSAPIAAPSCTIADSDLSRVLVLGYQYTGSVLQAFARRGRNGSDVAATAYSPYSGALTVGRHSDTTGNPGTDAFTVLGVMGGTGTITLAEYQAAFDAFESEEDIIAVPGKTTRLWSIKRSQDGTLQPTADAQGSGETLALVGAPTLSNIYTRGMAA